MTNPDIPQPNPDGQPRFRSRDSDRLHRHYQAVKELNHKQAEPVRDLRILESLDPERVKARQDSLLDTAELVKEAGFFPIMSLSPADEVIFVLKIASPNEQSVGIQGSLTEMIRAVSPPSIRTQRHIKAIVESTDELGGSTNLVIEDDDDRIAPFEKDVQLSISGSRSRVESPAVYDYDEHLGEIHPDSFLLPTVLESSYNMFTKVNSRFMNQPVTQVIVNGIEMFDHIPAQD